MQYFLDCHHKNAHGSSLCSSGKMEKIKMVKIKQSHKGIKLTSKSEGKIVGIKRKSPSESHRTLVFHLQ
jgi:DNA-directed RNA polymerase subunit H (RpoH/RPB5)